MKRYIKSAVEDMNTDRTTKLLVARDPSARPEVLAQLAESPDSFIRMSIATNPNTPVDVLEKLARDPHPDVRARVRDNKKLPKDIRSKLLSAGFAPSGDVEFTIYINGITSNDPNSPEIQKVVSDIKDSLVSHHCNFTRVEFMPDADFGTDEDDDLTDRLFEITCPGELSNRFTRERQIGDWLSLKGYSINDITWVALLK